jgi:hypothetical protein
MGSLLLLLRKKKGRLAMQTYKVPIAGDWAKRLNEFFHEEIACGDEKENCLTITRVRPGERFCVMTKAEIDAAKAQKADTMRNDMACAETQIRGK